MRCVGCEMDPLISVSYCECCGRKLSLHGTKAFEADSVTGPDHGAPDASPASGARCESCGGPSADGDFCLACQQAFDSWLGGAEPAATVSDPATTLPETAPVEERRRSELMTSTASSHDPSDMATPAELAVPPPVLREASLTSVDYKLVAAKAETVRTEEVKTQTAPSKGVKTEATYAEKTPKPAVVSKRPNVPIPSQRRRQSIALAATAVLVAAIGAGAYWFRIHEQSVIAREEQQTLVGKDVAEAKRRPSAGGPSAAATTATKGHKSAAAPPQSASVQPKPAMFARPQGAALAQAPAKAVRSSSPSTRQITSVSTPNPATEAPAPAVAPPAPDVVATAPTTASLAPPSGPFFETMDVNESPRVATRVEPQLPDELRARPLSEIVIVRVLVSQSGHPSRISLLRRSKTGPRLDNAVVAAVNQWTFSPARKRGEAVSCWFNFGVPVGRAN